MVVELKRWGRVSGKSDVLGVHPKASSFAVIADRCRRGFTREPPPHSRGKPCTSIGGVERGVGVAMFQMRLKLPRPAALRGGPYSAGVVGEWPGIGGQWASNQPGFGYRHRAGVLCIKGRGERGGNGHCWWVGEVERFADRFGNHSPGWLGILRPGYPLGLVAQPKENGCWKMTNPRSVDHAQ